MTGTTGMYIETEQLAKYTKIISRSINRSGNISAAKLARKASLDLSFIKSATERVSKLSSEKNKVSKAYEWLLDNWYLAEREGKNAILNLRGAGTLPATNGTRRTAVIAEAAWGLIIAGYGELTSERIEIFLDEFQNEYIFSEKELYNFPEALKCALVAFLAQLVKNLLENAADGEESSELAALMENIFTSFRMLSNLNATDMLARVNRVERILSADPAGVYPLMDEETRAYYRRTVSSLAAQQKKTAHDTAKQILALTEKGEENHVGYYIFESPLGKAKKRTKGGLYIASIVLLTLFFTLSISFALENIVACFLIVFPVSDIIKNIVDFFAVRIRKPTRIPRMELTDGITEDGKTICVMSTLFTSEKGIQKAAKALESYSLANRDSGKNLLFALLADLKGADEQVLPDDDALKSAAIREINEINARADGRFFVFLRERTYSEQNKTYMGWERKRGAITELVRFLMSKDTGVQCIAGDKKALQNVRYIIALDSDTKLTAGSAKDLVGAAMHPLNRAVVDSERKMVVRGSGIIQPRISVALADAGRSDFTRFFAGQGGIDPYGTLTSDVYQDLFGEGSFNGKGLIDVNAFYECLDQKFPENTILSHDLLEGAYLKCAYMGDTELTDGYPYKVTSFYERMHRWVRGDWQTLPWMLPRVRRADGTKAKNHLSTINRWKIFDNLRRSLVPVFTFAVLFLGMFISRQDFVWIMIVAVLSILSSLLISGAERIFRRTPSRRMRYHSNVISGFSGSLMQTLVRLIFLPYEAWICFSAAVTALWRMCVSKRNMLQWVTSADAESGLKNKALENYRRMWVCVLFGMLTLISPYAPAFAIGIIWLAAPLYAYGLSRELVESFSFSSEDKLFLTGAAGDIWRYFRDFLTEEDNYLPPDNWQEQPAAGVAHRTSPTNIGLALLSVLSAADLGITDEENATKLLERMITTIERLPKWNGHLYNWYDTRTMRVLEPGYVSAVDSGNLVGCLIALSEALLERGKNELAQRAKNLADAMQFAPLFDERRKLFYIGWDMAENKPTEGWYDLMSSEARQTSYIAIARGEVPRKHWSRLSRTLVTLEGYTGMASWTGTMFEYLMPNLLLPCYKNSFIYESSKFCVFAQKRRVSGMPWGISESAFYSFDAALNYRYKAHGVQSLALKRRMDTELVISPYSSFLALEVDPKGAVRNLRRLRSRGAEGRYGYYEALDYTPSRQTDSDYEIVRTYMAHHIGMSIVAINNALNENIMQKRFMRDREMGAFSELLEERVPVGEVVMCHQPRDVPDKPERISTEGWESVNEGVDILNPKCVLLSNGQYSVLMTESGMTRSECAGIRLTCFEPMQLSAHNGMSFWLKVGDEVISLLPSPDFMPDAEYISKFTGSNAQLSAAKGDIRTSVAVSVPNDEVGERRSVSISYNGKKPTKAQLLCYFEPVMSAPEDYNAHPTFSRLSLEFKQEGNTLTIRRRGQKAPHARYAAFAVDREAVFETSKQNAFYRTAPNGKTAELTDDEITSASPEACILASVELLLTPEKTETVNFALAPAQTQTEASEAAERIIGSEPQFAASRLDGLAKLLKLSTPDITGAMSLVTDITFTTEKRKKLSEFMQRDSEGQRGLWRFGISGDLPIISARVENMDKMKQALNLISRHALISASGARFDLVLIVSDGTDYRTPMRSAVVDYLRLIDCERNLGAKGGVHLVDKQEAAIDCIFAESSAEINLDDMDSQASRNTERRIRFRDSSLRSDAKVDYRADKNGEVTFNLNGALPANSWSNILTNGRYGFVATDAGTGSMWHLNARENRINRWLNDSLTTRGTERLIYNNGSDISLFADNDSLETTVIYGMGYSRWEKKLGSTEAVVTAFVPLETDARVIMIELSSAAEKDSVTWYTDLVLGSDETRAPRVTTRYENGVFTSENSANSDYPQSKFTAMFSEIPTAYTTDKLAFETGEMDSYAGSGVNAGLAVELPAVRKLVIVCGCDDAEKMRQLLDPSTAAQELEKTISHWQALTAPVKIETESPHLDVYINGWALYQTYACRILARTSIYQSGGAYGFRDQLQDCLALITSMPEKAAKQIVRAASHQYSEGDVQHWWHENLSGGADKGVRTRYSDDLLWLPYALTEYTDKTGELSFLKTEVAYLVSPVLTEGEHERYEQPQISGTHESLFDHAVRAAELVLERGTGEHGLCLIGCGDWNDGMNLVGAKGKGESVWLTWFAANTLSRFSGLCEKMGRRELSERYAAAAEKFRRAADGAWDGKWYLRGYFDNGMPLGSSKSEECKIDSIAQSFSVLGGGSVEKTQIALKSTLEHLFDREHKIMKLFTPSFDRAEPNPGYIRNYNPGMRENGGQYTHAAVWFALALFRSGMTEDALEVMDAILPATHEQSAYKKEPYVLAGDVSANADNMALGGWSWYTGASGWYYRVAVEELLGIVMEEGRLYIRPNLPKSWKGYSAEVKMHGLDMKIEVTRRESYNITVNGKPYDEKGYSIKINNNLIYG